MIPPIIKRRLLQLRLRERMLQLLWGVVRWLCLVLVVLALGCLVDWVWDRYQDVPQETHYVLLGLTCAAALVGFIGFVLVPLLTGIHDDTLALWIEEKVPEFRDRLISAVQLNRAGAKTQGMSPHLIDVVTKEATARAEAQSFAHVADHRRLGWTFKLLVPVLFFVILPIVAAPVVAHVLLSRHFLGDVEIPRDVRIELVKQSEVWPAGEKVTLKFRVHAKNFDPHMVGDVWVTPKGMPRDRYPLEYHEEKDGDVPIFSAEVAAGTIDFDYTARIGDGRLKAPGHVTMVPRPSIEELLAWTILPGYVGAGERDEISQPRGDIVGIPGSSARVKITTPRPIAKGHLELLKPKPVKKDDGDAEAKEPAEAKVQLSKAGDLPSTEPVDEEKSREVAMTVEEGGKSATAQFDLDPKETGYRVVLEDEYGFDNRPPPRRSVRVIEEEKPTVNLLKDYFTPGSVGSKDQLEDFNIDSFPVPVGKPIRIPYVAEGPYGLGQADLFYRVIHPTESGNEQPEDELFKRISLPRVKATDKSGDFDPRRGVFENTPVDKAVDFFAMPLLEPGRMLGGGRYHFQTSGIPDGKGGTLQLKDGDKIEYFIRVYADRDPDKHPKRPKADSETRVTTIGSEESFVRWFSDYFQEAQRLNEINRKQRGIFGQK
jgi:hypothetical protein